MGGLFGDVFGAIKEWQDGESDEKFAKEQAKNAQSDHWNRINAQNFEYAKPSDAAPEYKATVSPVARSYLESFLTGANPDAVQGTRTGSAGLLGDKAKAQANFQQAYGGWDKLKKQGDAELSAPDRFAVKPIAGVGERSNKDAETTLSNPQHASFAETLGRPLTPEENEYLLKVWKTDHQLGGANGASIGTKNMPAFYLNRLPKEALEKLLRDRPKENTVATVEGYW